MSALNDFSDGACAYRVVLCAAPRVLLSLLLLRVPAVTTPVGCALRWWHTMQCWLTLTPAASSSPTDAWPVGCCRWWQHGAARTANGCAPVACCCQLPGTLLVCVRVCVLVVVGPAGRGRALTSELRLRVLRLCDRHLTPSWPLPHPISAPPCVCPTQHSTLSCRPSASGACWCCRSCCQTPPSSSGRCRGALPCSRCRWAVTRRSPPWSHWRRCWRVRSAGEWHHQSALCQGEGLEALLVAVLLLAATGQRPVTARPTPLAQSTSGDWPACWPRRHHPHTGGILLHPETPLAPLLPPACRL